MGIFSRLRDIISSNVNAMLEKAEDPEKLVKLMIQEMEDTLVEVKASCAGVMAQQKKTGRELERTRAAVGRWEENALLAVQKGRDDLAREALMEKRRFQQHVDALDAELTDLEALVGRYQDDIMQLEEKLGAVREKQRVLVQRHVHARGRKRAQRDIRRADTSDAFVRFERFENRIERMEAEADLVNFGRKPGLEDEFLALAADEEIERELDALKDRAGEGAEESDDD
jgi:phage shock protein A